MRPSLLIASVLVASLGSILGQSPPASSARAPLPPLMPDYKLVWADEFSHDPDGLPDPAKWNFEHGYVRNHEPQYYTANRLENARVEHGHLIIEIRKESYTPPDASGAADGHAWTDKTIKAANYTSACLDTVGKACWLYGRIEIRAKMPKGNIMWPALWTLGTNITTAGWPRCGEIDLLEMLQTNVASGNFHYAINGKHVSSDFAKLLIPTSYSDFHTYTFDWNADRIDLYADGERFTSLDVNKANEKGENPYRKPHYLILNVALHGGKIDDSIFPQQMVIEYVRVYQKAAQ